jgi:hypothetical protein
LLSPASAVERSQQSINEYQLLLITLLASLY